jgi:hypothetical protein
VSRPSAVAYIGAQVLATSSELPSLKEAIAEFATVSGFVLLATYVEAARATPAAFGEMLSGAWRDGVGTVIFPNIVHLAALGNPAELKTHLEHHIRGKVLFLNPRLSPPSKSISQERARLRASS